MKSPKPIFIVTMYDNGSGQVQRAQANIEKVMSDYHVIVVGGIHSTPTFTVYYESGTETLTIDEVTESIKKKLKSI